MTSSRADRTPRVRSLLLAVAALLVTVPVVGSEAQTAPCAAVRRLSPLWEQIARPDFGVGPAAIRAYAVSPHAPDFLYVTNGVAVARSDNGGCNFETVFRLADAGLQESVNRIESIVIPETVDGRRRVYLTVVEAGEGVGRPHVIRSSDGQPGTFQLADNGLPPIGDPTDLRISPTNAAAMYLTLRSVPGLPGTPTSPIPGVPGTPVPTGPSGAVYRSNDGGATWAAASDSTDFAGSQAVEDLAIMPATPRAIWVIAGGRLRYSTDGGTTYSDAGLPVATQAARGYRFTAVDVLTNGTIVAFSATSASGGSRALISTDGGRTFADRPGPAEVRSVAHTKDTNTVTVGTLNGAPTIQRFMLSSGRAAAITPPATGDVDFGVTTDRLRGTVYGYSSAAVYRARPAQPEPGKDDDPFTPLPVDIGDPPIAPARLTPGNVHLQLEVGQTREVDYVLDLPRRPTRLDVFLVIDNSGSMKSLIQDVQANLGQVIKTLVDSGINVHAGASMYQTTQDPPLYQRLTDVRKPDAELFTQLGQMKADSEGMDEPVLIALQQVALGNGLNTYSFLPVSDCALGLVEIDTGNEAVDGKAPCRIKPGQRANFRPKSLRVVLHATNERFDRPLKDIDDSQEPSFDDVAKAFNGRQIEHIGIAAGPEAADNLRRMSEMTGTLAPPAGVDCDQDGSVDVRPNQPIVCAHGGRLSDTLVNVLNAVRDVQPVRFHAGAPSPVLQSVTPELVPTVNVKQHNVLRFRARFSCVNVAPSTHEVKLGAVLGGDDTDLANASALVTCGAPLVPAGANPPNGNNPAPGQQQPQPLQPAQPAPAIPVPQLQPVPQAQVQPQANPNPQAGSAAEEDDVPQLATVTEATREDGEKQLAMTGLAVAGLMTAAAGSVLGRRSRDRAAVGAATVRSGTRAWARSATDPWGRRR